MEKTIVALLGNCRAPADGVVDYCNCLLQALSKRGFRVHIYNLPWVEAGYRAALYKLWKESAQWRGRWVLIQYTAQAWSKKGFPFSLPIILLILRIRHTKLGIIFHDEAGYPGDRIIDKIRRKLQEFLMRYAVKKVDRAIFTIDPKCLFWLGNLTDNPQVSFIPVGSNIPVEHNCVKNHNPAKRVVVFGIDTGSYQHSQVLAVSNALKQASRVIENLELILIGPGAVKAEHLFKESLKENQVKIEVPGYLPANKISQILTSSDVQFFIHGEVKSNRTTAIAGIMHGLPIVGYKGERTAFPITEAGVRLVSRSNPDKLGDELTLVLTNDDLRAELSERSLKTGQNYFSWNSIAQSLINSLNK